jgi:hypothetical protein
LLGGGHRVKALKHPLVVEYIINNKINISKWAFKLLRVEIWADFEDCTTNLFSALGSFDNELLNDSSVIRTTDIERACQVARVMKEYENNNNMTNTNLRNIILDQIVSTFIYF